MIKGLGREKSLKTLVCVVITFVNIFIVFKAISTLGEQDINGKFVFAAEVIPPDYYLYLVLSLGFGFASMWLINYPDPQGRWGARIFCALLFPCFLLLYTLNMRIFSWSALFETVF